MRTLEPGGIEIGPATAAERSAIEQLLTDCDLPASDVARHVAHFVAARRRGALVGVAGFEPAGGYGLLRSLAVAREHRGRGIARALVEEVERSAARRDVSRLYLLTTTAEKFFASSGYAKLSRESAPPEIRATLEFTRLCPDTAIVMAKQIRPLRVCQE